MNPASAYCQRWQTGTHSFRHPNDGGFDPSRFQAVRVDRAIAEQFVVRHHYAATRPATKYAYALLTDDERLNVDGTEVESLALVGVAILSVPMQRAVLTGVFPTLEPYEQSVELGRFVLTDTPANAESWFLGRIFDLAADAGVRGVVSFADPMPRQRQVPDGDLVRTETVTPGHVGLIYQATNGYACGRSTARTLTYLPRHGLVINDRMQQKIRAQESGADAAERRLVELGAPVRRGMSPRAWLPIALDAMGATRVRHPGNFRYAWALGNRTQRRGCAIALPRSRYPKPAADVMGAAA